MSDTIRVLAFDLGASSGRAMLGILDKGHLSLTEIHRFSNDPVSISGTLYWDVYRLFHEIKQGILKALAQGGFDSIGIDTWGVDFGLLRADGSLVECPVHYRDTRTRGVMDAAFANISRKDLYRITGIQVMELNTAFQLHSLARERSSILDEANSLLLMSDLFNYFLTGVQKTEYSIATTTQMIDVRTGTWSPAICDALGIPLRLLTDIVPSGTVIGSLRPALCTELGCPAVKIIAIAGHDTQSAVVAVPALNDEFAFLSSGTWSLLGTERDEPILSDTAQSLNITNEGGFGGKITVLKNIVGLYLVQECRRQWEREGIEYSFAKLCTMAQEAPEVVCFIDPDDPLFTAPGNLPERIREYCKRTGQPVPEASGEIIKCIYNSLAFKYRWALEQIETCTGKQYPLIHIVGGGARDSYLCQLTANACARKVLSGPIEATVLGNIAIQYITLGVWPGIREARKIIANSYPVETFKPEQIDPNSGDLRERAYSQFLAVCGTKKER